MKKILMWSALGLASSGAAHAQSTVTVFGVMDLGIQYTSGDGGAHWRGVLSTLGGVLPVRLPGGPGSYPGPFSVIDPRQALLLSPTPAAEATGAVLISQGGSRLRRLPDLPGTTLFMPRSVSFASATRGWVDAWPARRTPRPTLHSLRCGS